MIQGSNRRLANVKTRSETGLDYVMKSLDLNTSFGRAILKESKPFFPGQEEELRMELNMVGDMITFVNNNKRKVELLSEAFMEVKEITHSVEKSKKDVLTVVEIYDIKSMLLQMRKIVQVCVTEPPEIPSKYILEDTEELLDILDPRKDRINTFYIYDDFSEKLTNLRKRKKEIEHDIRRRQKARKEEIRKQYGIVLTPKFDVVISKTTQELERAKNIEDLEQVAEDYMSVTFELTKSEEIYALMKEAEDLNTEIEEEEFEVRGKLSKTISKYADTLLENCRKIGELDVALGKASHAIRYNCTKPNIVDEHIIKIEEGRHLQVEDVLKRKGRDYCPISISLKDGVTCITGANMGGKTISLKLVGLVSILAQYGFFVPAKSADIGLSNYMQILVGDSQSVERGLSSFGSEMEELKEILDNSVDRSILMIDEIASGTNPIEGLALTKSLIEFIKEKPYITLMTTHFEAVTEEEDVKNMQVVGLADVDFRKLDSELHRANRKERINIVSRYMDYRLYEVTENRRIPKDALNIAKMLGINKEIIDGAKKYIK